MNNWSSRHYELQHIRRRDHSPFGGFGRQEVSGHSRSSRNQNHFRQRFRAHSPPEYKARPPYDLANTGQHVSGFSRKTGFQQIAGYGTTVRKWTRKGSVYSDSEQNRRSNVVSSSRSLHTTADKKHCKRPHSSADTVEAIPAKLSCKTSICESSKNDQKAASLVAAHEQKLVDCETAVSSGTNAKTPPKPKRPAQNLTVGIPFDLASHLDAARKKTRRDFDPDVVTVVRQSGEGSRLLQLRPEFNSTETTPSHDDSILSVRLPLALYHSDTNCAARLGALISQTIDRHVDLEKLRQTAESVSHRLQPGTAAKNSEREIVCRPKPVLISTVCLPASNIRDRVPLTVPKFSASEQPASHMAAECSQAKLHSPNTIQPVQTSANTGNWIASRTGIGVMSGEHFTAVCNSKSSDVSQIVTSSTDGQLRSGTDVQRVQRITVGKRATNTHLHLQPKNLSDGDGGRLMMKGDRSISL